MNLEVLHIARRIAKEHGVPVTGILVVCESHSYAKARHALWAELNRLGCTDRQIADAWCCKRQSVANVLDAPVRRSA